MKEDLTLPLLRIDSAGITTLRLNRPDQYNALTKKMIGSLQAQLDQIATDTSVRVLIIEGTGKAFCAGHDLKEMRAHHEEAYFVELFQECSRMMMTLSRIPQPVIAKVHGLATAAGCQLVAACDLAIASETARFAASGINVGLFCATPAVPISRKLGRKRAMEMLLTGEFMTASEALVQGLVNRVVPPNQLDPEVEELTEKLLSKSGAALSIGKEMFYKQLDMPVEEAYRYASNVMARNMMLEDAAEGIDAFINKRNPTWKHR